MIKARCKKCDHLFIWDEDRYSKQNHVIHCKQCGGFLAGGFKCHQCGQVITMLGPVPPEECVICHTTYTKPLRESI